MKQAGKPELESDQKLARVARRHSERMASGRVGLGHDGMDDRVKQLVDSLGIARYAENVSSHDRDDGFVHLSGAAQVRGTLARYFAGRTDLVLLSVDPRRLPEGALRWESSRAGEAFPHLYASLERAAVLRADALALEAGGHRFPPDLPLPLDG